MPVRRLSKPKYIDGSVNAQLAIDGKIETYMETALTRVCRDNGINTGYIIDARSLTPAQRTQWDAAIEKLGQVFKSFIEQNR
ncbi:MAG: hypothetical protein WC346_02840 [Methanogenium sp.]|jgi:hypothetical protein